LEKLGYDDGGRIIFIRLALPFLICGVSSFAQTDVCVMDDNEVLLLVQEDKRLLSLKDPEPQVVAEAIAAYALNNKVRVTALSESSTTRRRHSSRDHHGRHEPHLLQDHCHGATEHCRSTRDISRHGNNISLCSQDGIAWGCALSRIESRF
jgi:hypothetical protein